MSISRSSTFRSYEVKGKKNQKISRAYLYIIFPLFNNRHENKSIHDNSILILSERFKKCESKIVNTFEVWLKKKIYKSVKKSENTLGQKTSGKCKRPEKRINSRNCTLEKKSLVIFWMKKAFPHFFPLRSRDVKTRSANHGLRQKHFVIFINFQAQKKIRFWCIVKIERLDILPTHRRSEYFFF